MIKADAEDTMVFFGSPRCLTKKQYKQKFEEMKAAGEDTTTLEKKERMWRLHERRSTLSGHTSPESSGTPVAQTKIPAHGNVVEGDTERERLSEEVER